MAVTPSFFVYIRTGKAASILGVTPGTVRALVAAGKLSAFKVGKQLRFNPATVEKFLAASRVESSPLPLTEST